MDYGNEYLWVEEQFRIKDKLIVYKVLSLNYLSPIAYIRITKKGYDIFKTHYDLTLGESLKVFGLARVYQEKWRV
jgi:hypothetical protein